MGTRSLTFVLDENSNPIVCIYRQFDGYPDGHGQELLEYLKKMKRTEGLTHNKGEVDESFNGMSELAAKLVCHLKCKNPNGNIYLEPVTTRQCWQEYEYTVFLNDKGELCLSIYGCSEGTNIFGGKVDEFEKWLDGWKRGEKR